MKRIMVSVLVLALSVSTYAGVMDNGKPSPPPDSPSTGATTGATPLDPVTALALNLLQSVLSLF